MCSSAAIKAKIRYFYYGAPAEKSMDPWITLKNIAKKSKKKVHIVSGILKEDCQKQILNARRSLKKK